MKRLRRYVPFVLVALVAFCIGGLAWSAGGIENLPLSAAARQGDGSPALTPAQLDDQKIALAVDRATQNVVDNARPAVVEIKTTFPAQQTANSPFSDPFFSQFFGPWYGAPQQQQPEVGVGSGFIIDQDGHILTNEHVVGTKDQNAKIQVKISTPQFNGWVDAKLLGSDYDLDLAVIKIEKPKGLDTFPTLPLGNSDDEHVGERVIAIGNPYGDQFANTVTTGVLSAQGRGIDVPDDQRRQVKHYSNLMQTDAAINPGNSGGPLINMKGEVIGINTAVNAAAQGIGFAIPINAAIRVKEDLITNGKVPHAYMGVRIGNLTDQLEHFLGVDGGIIVAGVEPDSPADKAGLQEYDVITAVNGKAVKSMSDLQGELQTYKPGDTITLAVIRDRKNVEVKLKLGTQPTTQSNN